MMAVKVSIPAFVISIHAFVKEGRKVDDLVAQLVKKIFKTILIQVSLDVREKVSLVTTFDETLMFNSAVSRFSGSMWMYVTLISCDTIVKNIVNSFRLQEECEGLSLCIATCNRTRRPSCSLLSDRW